MAVINLSETMLVIIIVFIGAEKCSGTFRNGFLAVFTRSGFPRQSVVLNFEFTVREHASVLVVTFFQIVSFVDPSVDFGVFATYGFVVILTFRILRSINLPPPILIRVIKRAIIPRIPVLFFKKLALLPTRALTNLIVIETIIQIEPPFV